MLPLHNQMVERNLDTIFTALADPTRRAMLDALALGEKTVGELAAPHRMSFAGAAKHVAVLTRAGLVSRRKVGRQQVCRLEAGPLREAEEWLRRWESFWTDRLDALDAALQEKPQ